MSDEVDVEQLIAEASDDKTKALRKEIDRLSRALDKEKARTEAITEAIHNAISAGLSSVVLPPVKKPEKSAKPSTTHIAVAILSDWQLGKLTPSYNSQVCEQRIEVYADKFLKLVEETRQARPVDRLAVFLVGDMVEGELIFPGQSWAIDASLYRQVTMDGPRILGSFARRMAEAFPQVDIYAVPGNHGFLGGRSRKEMHPESNADRMLYQIGKLMSQDVKHMTWHVTEDWWMPADLGAKCRFMLCHGNQVRGYNGIPWYGWTRKTMGWSMMSRIWEEMTFDYVAAGHFHTPVSIYVNGIRLWINGSTESHNPYAAEQLAAAGEPSQWMLIAKPGLGVVSEHLIQLGP